MRLFCRRSLHGHHRRYNLILAAVFAIIGTIMQAAASGHIAAIFVGRFIAGLGVGAASMVTPLYSKYSPKALSRSFY
jgi:MFS family permease